MSEKSADGFGAGGSGACVSCGSCRSVCPAYRAARDELACARGKMKLIEMIDNGLADQNADDVALANCLLCGGCSSVCPVNLDPTSIFVARRAQKLDNKISAPLTRGLASAVDSQKKLRLWARASAGVSDFFGRNSADDSTTRESDDRAGVERFAALPKIAGRFFLDNFSGELPGANPDGGRTVYFVGCLNNFFQVSAAESVLRILQSRSREVYIPQTQVCCGLPALTVGDLDRAASAVEKNIAGIFDGGAPDRVVTSCSSCAAMIKDYTTRLVSGAEKNERAARLAEIVIDFPGYLALSDKSARKRTANSAGSKEIRVTIHDGCHSTYSLGQGRDLRKTISETSGVKLVEMDEPGACCGFGGSFHIRQPQLADLLLQKKLASIRETGADYIVTPCPGCALMLNSGDRKSLRKIPAISLAELFDLLKG